MPKFTFLKPFHILSNLLIQICTLANSSWVHQSCAALNNYSDPVFGAWEIVLFKFCHLYLQKKTQLPLIKVIDIIFEEDISEKVIYHTFCDKNMWTNI